MADTIREQIIASMITRFQTIKKTAGYKNDLGDSIHHLRETNFETAELPALNIVDRSNNIEHFSCSQFENALDVDLEVKVASGTTTFKTAYSIIEDVYRAIAADDTWGGLAIDTRPVSDEIDGEHADQVVAAITIRIEVKYAAPKWTF